jgi:hypothetical protein
MWGRGKAFRDNVPWEIDVEPRKVTGATGDEAIRACIPAVRVS